jgi:GNAT superfamily N-acetyltransferase
MSPVSISSPEPLTSNHVLDDFSCGEPALDEWLRRHALRNQHTYASRTYVVCSGNRVVGYYALAVGAVAHDNAPGKIKRNMPDPVPVMILGRLAVDQRFQGRGVASGLLRDSILRTIQAAEIAGIRAMLVHAISESARRFYENYGFSQSPLDPLTLMITIGEAQKELAQ